MKENTPHISLNIGVILCVVKEMFFFVAFDVLGNRLDFPLSILHV